MLRKSLTFVATALPLILVTAAPVFAYDVQDQINSFPSCLNPQTAASQVNTDTKHGVVGYPNQSFSGTDSIYSVQDDNTLQCLCAGNDGYQTEWVKASDLSDDEIKVLQSQGWTYYADAGSWGLNGAYLAKTNTYSCSGPTPTPTTTCTPTPTTTPGPTATPTPNATNTPTPQTQSSVLSLANTGNAVFIYALALAGASSLILGMVLRKFSK